MDQTRVFTNPASESHLPVYSPHLVQSPGLFDLNCNLLHCVEGIEISTYQLDVTELNSGIHFLRLLTAKGVENIKFVKRQVFMALKTCS